MASAGYYPGTSPDQIAGTAGRLYGPLKATICAVEAQAKAYEQAHHVGPITSDFTAWKKATGRRSEALFLKWQAVRRRSEWDAYRLGAGLRNYGAW